MSMDIVADALNKMMNAVRAKKSSITVSHHSKLLLSVLAIAKLKGYVKSYKLEDNILHIEIGELAHCGSIKPRFVVKSDGISKYIPRFLPAKNLGILILTTSQGLMTHQTAMDKNIGGGLLAYMY